MEEEDFGEYVLTYYVCLELPTEDLPSEIGHKLACETNGSTRTTFKHSRPAIAV